MKKIFAILILFSATVSVVSAQIFIEKARIEFEEKSNFKKKLGNVSWLEGLKDNLPNQRVQYYDYTYANNKGFYKLNRIDEKNKIPDWLDENNEENEWYTDLTTGTMQLKKIVVGAPFNIKDSLPVIEWKLVNENMNIAGFNCRKAIGKIYDSVYVFAFYAEELPISGGPCSISGLPGMILGMTIPRLYTSWLATKVIVNGVNEEVIKPAPAKKTMLNREYRNILIDRTKDWGGGEDGEANGFREQFLWSALL
jgi:GLPGLI family protein